MSKYKLILDSLQEVVFEMDSNANITFANHTALSFFGISEEELARGVNALDYIVPEERPRAVRNISSAIMGQSVANNEYTLLKKDGTKFPVVIRGNPIIENSMPVGLRGFIVDISKVKNIEIILNRYQLLSKHDRDIIIFCRQDDGQIIEANNAAIKAYGYSREELLTMNIKALIAASSLPDSNMDCFARMNPSDQVFETLHHGKDKACFPVEVSSYVFMEDEPITLLIIRDISERKKLEELRNNLFTNISHDLRIPLTLIKGYIETIRSGCLKNPDEEKKYLEMINDKITAMGNLTQDLMEYAQLSARQVKLNKKSMRVSQFLQMIYDSFSPDITSQGLKLALKFPKPIIEAEAVPLISIDPDQMNRVFENLLFNAIRYMPDKGTITIGYTLRPKTEASPIIYVKDTGTGISSEDLPYVFNRFYRGSKGCKADPGGKGLGLAIVKEIVEYHDGHIWVDSTPGKGTTFYFSLPFSNMAN